MIIQPCDILDQIPEASTLIYDDLISHGPCVSTGRPGLTGDQALRVLLLKQMNGFSYVELAFHLADSRCYRAFCGFGIDEKSPLSRSEYVTALAHFYRAEMYRSMVWRTRLDTSTNWAIISTLAILSTSLNNPEYATESLLLGMFVNAVFLVIEARRFRFFNVWRARVRMMEENFYGGILRRDQTSMDQDWGKQVADDLLCPRFHLTRMQAFRARLMRNFRFIFALFLLARIGHRIAPGAPDKFMSGLNVFPVWVPDALVGILYLVLILIAIFTPKAPPPEEAYWPHPDHPGEDISSLDV